MPWHPDGADSTKQQWVADYARVARPGVPTRIVINAWKIVLNAGAQARPAEALRPGLGRNRLAAGIKTGRRRKDRRRPDRAGRRSSSRRDPQTDHHADWSLAALMNFSV